MSGAPRIVEAGATPVAAVASGAVLAAADADGALHLFTAEGEPLRAVAHEGGILALAADPQSGGFLTGGDDGRLVLTGQDGRCETLAAFDIGWVDCVAAGRDVRAASTGRAVHAWRPGMARADRLEHPSTVAGLAFDAKGRRLAVAHYGGVTVWEPARRGWKASRLVWHGSHRMVTVSPDGRFVVTAMQEPTLHGWRLRDKADMRMAGYAVRVKAMAWVGEGAWLATAGADCAVCWPFDGPSGPMGRAPMLVAARDGIRCTAVAALPGAPFLLAGYADGAVAAAELLDGAPGRTILPPGSAAVVALTSDPDSTAVLAADAEGRLKRTPLR